MKTIIVFENSNLTFEGEDAENVAIALFNAEASGAKGVTFKIPQKENSMIGERKYQLNQERYLFWYTEKE